MTKLDGLLSFLEPAYERFAARAAALDPTPDLLEDWSVESPPSSADSAEGEPGPAPA